MTKKLLAGAAVTAAALAALVAPAAAKGGPKMADGTCVAKGVAGLTGPQIAGAAQAGLVSLVILDHVFNAAGDTGGITGADC
jgi:uncharacterized membrane protein